MAPVIHRLSSSLGIEAAVSNYGATLLSLLVPDRHGTSRDIVLGFDTLSEYAEVQPRPYFGATIGRYANRIARGRFTRGGTTWALSLNENSRHHCHGGFSGLDRVIWQIRQADEKQFVLFHRSSAGEEGYPGTLDITVSYRLEGEALAVEYDAITDASTPVSLTNHSYFNLAGESSGTVLDHLLELNAHGFTPVDDEWLPTGEIRSVKGTPFDFTKLKKIGRDMGSDDPQLCRGPGGYDHNFALNRASSGGETFCARVIEPVSGRVLEVSTTEPGVHFYTANYLDGSICGKSGRHYGRHAGFCLETQQFPDSPNRPQFPNPFIEPGKPYRSRTCFRFRT